MRTERCSDSLSAQQAVVQSNTIPEEGSNLAPHHLIRTNQRISTATNAPAPAFGPAAESCAAWNRLDGSRILEVGGQAHFAC
ncbi:hypothetical protein PspLS_09983 [Pyricularia sp. CBS 133598]|nr:hypothetical protein PspLS_09983 [Pyricularia sp. CBS 133598]